jgi:hypothetical protein
MDLVSSERETQTADRRKEGGVDCGESDQACEAGSDRRNYTDACPLSSAGESSPALP